MANKKQKNDRRAFKKTGEELSSNGSSSLAEVAEWRVVRNTTAKSLREVIRNEMP